jgi:hypothetical protein
MSNECATETREGDRETTAGAVTPTVRGLLTDRYGVVLAVSTLALFTVTSRTLIVILGNLPFDPLVAFEPVRTGTAVLFPVAVAGALVTIALTDERTPVRVGLLFAGVFGLLGLLIPTTTLPAVVAISAGGALALLGTLGIPDAWTYGTVRRRAIATGFVLAIAISLASAVGIADGLRGVGALIALASLAAVGTRAEASPVAAGAGIAAAVLLVVGSHTSPFLAGSALLVGFGITGVPHLVVAVAVGGGVAAAVAGARRREYPLALGALFVLVAGVPVTLPQAMAVLLGAALVVLDWSAVPDSEVAL